MKDNRSYEDVLKNGILACKLRKNAEKKLSKILVLFAILRIVEIAVVLTLECTDVFALTNIILRAIICLGLLSIGIVFEIIVNASINENERWIKDLTKIVKCDFNRLHCYRYDE